MNAKKCKALRRLAQSATVGEKHRIYLQDNNKIARNGNRLPGTIRLSPLCTRGTYRNMKRLDRKIAK